MGIIDNTAIKQQIERLQEWLDANAPEIGDEQRHLDKGTEARAYWHYGRLVALRAVLKSAES